MVVDWTAGLLTYQGITYNIAAGGTDKKYIYWDPNYTTIFRTTDNLQDVFDCDGWLMCINESGTPYAAYALRVIHGALIQAGTISAQYGQIADATITTAKIANLAVETLKIADNAVTIPTSAYTDGTIEVPQSAYTTIQQITVTSTGSAIHLICSTSLFAVAATKYIDIRLRRGSTTIYESINFHCVADNYASVAFGIQDTPGAGSVTYYLQARGNTDTNCYCTKRSMLALEVKK